MRILNLVYPDKSDIKYKKIQFPDGQQSLTILEESIDDEVQIYSRFNSFLDLELIFCACSALEDFNRTSTQIFLPYLLGARSDRRFEDGGTNYLKDVTSNILSPLMVDMGWNNTIVTLDVHSKSALSYIPGLRNEQPIEFIDKTLKSINSKDLVVVSPDKGAKDRLEVVLPYSSIVQCDKERDLATGKIIKTIVPLIDTTLYENVDFLIVDDICDGGRTFIEIAKEIERILPGHKGKKYLYVTHGIFSHGFGELSLHFDHIYCTNSVQDIDMTSRSFYTLGDIEKSFSYKNLITQFNIF